MSVSNSFWTFVCFWPSQPSYGSKFHSWVAHKQNKTLFCTVLASFWLGFWCYLLFVLWETLHKHSLFSPHHSWFLMHWACPPSAVFIPVYHGLFYLIILLIWSLVILIALLCTNSSSALPWNTRVWEEEWIHGKRQHEDLNYKSSLSSIRLYWKGFKGKGNHK